jgi:hypothetical protein
MVFPDQPAGSHRVFSSTRPVPAPGRPGPGSTHWTGPDFKTMMATIKTRVGLPFFFLVIKVYKTYLKTIIKRFYFISVFCFFFFIFIMLVLKL